MADLRLEREFSASPETLFSWISDGAKLLQWWGPEGLHVPEHDLDFSRLGPWYSVMVNDEGQRYKVSGHVTHIDPPKSVGFTWAWHDDQDQRGAESHVTFSVEAIPGGARLILDHRELADQEAAANHEMGWTSSLRKLQGHLS
ncbi:MULTISPECIES: SRPBCC domain-containing protein [Alphaproteobacteria]|uniref:SRPBCC family protein n=1 Tax=Alphaproteobacteria TaxID=28211 RepID=UPI0012BC0462|nr:MULTISPECIES: SRPBCC domain-containing protein [Alphaproteobacteria]MTI01035.1 SRPBCC domain-containing protein [Roseibium sp. RKSG952]